MDAKMPPLILVIKVGLIGLCGLSWLLCSSAVASNKLFWNMEEDLRTPSLAGLYQPSSNLRTPTKYGPHAYLAIVAEDFLFIIIDPGSTGSHVNEILIGTVPENQVYESQQQLREDLKLEWVGQDSRYSDEPMLAGPEGVKSDLSEAWHSATVIALPLKDLRDVSFTTTTVIVVKSSYWEGIDVLTAVSGP